MSNGVELKKVASFSLLLLLLLVAIVATRWNMSVAGSPGTLEVPSSEYPTIQDAINNASAGDLIFVHDGIYSQSLVINESVSLVGEDSDLTVIYGSGASPPNYVINVIASGVTIEDFTVRASSSIQSPVTVSSPGSVLENNIIEEGYNGIQLFSSDNVVSNNTIHDNQYAGLYLYASNHNVFSDNLIVNNVVVGVVLDQSANNVFSGNTIYDNTEGLTLSSSPSNNVFYHNNFNNTVQLSSDSVNSTNVWSLNGEGNYWSDYTGQNLNNDGIGDIPYKITDTEGPDDYPLMGPFHDLEVSLTGQEYNVNLISNSSVSGLKFMFGQETGNKILLFNVAGGGDNVGFGRIMIPLSLMDTPFIILGGQGEITPTVLNASNATNVYLYFTWVDSNQTISIISSEALQLYNDLLGEYANLLADLNNLNVTQSSFLANYSTLLGDLTDLESKYFALNSSYYSQLSDYSRNVENLQNLMYVFASTTAVFLITTVYLSKRANMSVKQKPKGREKED
jgi:parallel beta-helix repeat protein